MTRHRSAVRVVPSGDPPPRRPSSFPRSLHPPANRLHFPIPPPIRAQNRAACDKDFDVTYVRSGSRKLLPLIRNFSCANCRPSQHFSLHNLPSTGPCGHFFCATHKRVKTGVALDGQMSVYHECDKCRSRTEVAVDYRCPTNPLMRDLYTALDVRNTTVFQCLDCDKFHPMYNSVGCFDCARRARGGADSATFCVWCAVKRHDSHRLRNVTVNDLSRPHSAPANLLHSLDSTHFQLIAALVQCAECAHFLVANNLDTLLIHDDVVQMPCGRMVDDDCLPRNHTACNFCCANHPNIAMGHRSAKHIDDVAAAMGRLFVCQARSNCGKHPNDNGVLQSDGKTRVCVWCTLMARDEQQRVVSG